MRDRYLSLVATIATSALIACGDAAVEDLTAPPLAATPAAPVTDDEWPSELDFEGIPSAIGIQITVSPGFEDGNKTFVVDARVRFQWANEVSANVRASLINKEGNTINQGVAGMTYRRIALPVPQGDSTFTVRISTNNITCGLIGKSSYSGRAATRAIDLNLVQLVLWEQEINETSGPDVLQPACPPPPGCEPSPGNRVIAGTSGILASENEDCAPAPPNGGGDDDFEFCYTVWRELWVWDYFSGSFNLQAEWIIGTFCFLYSQLVS